MQDKNGKPIKIESLEEMLENYRSPEQLIAQAIEDIRYDLILWCLENGYIEELDEYDTTGDQIDAILARYNVWNKPR